MADVVDNVRTTVIVVAKPFAVMIALLHVVKTVQIPAEAIVKAIVMVIAKAIVKVIVRVTVKEHAKAGVKPHVVVVALILVQVVQHYRNGKPKTLLIRYNSNN